MQPPQPLGVTDVSFSARPVLGVPGIDQHHLEATLLEDLVDRDPIDAGRFHGDRLHAAALEPVRQKLQVAGAGRKTAHRLGTVSIGRNGCYMHPRADVDRRRVWVDGRDVPLGAEPLRPGHDKLLLQVGRRSWAAQGYQLPDRDHREGVTTLKCASGPWATFFDGVIATKTSPAALLLAKDSAAVSIATGGAPARDGFFRKSSHSSAPRVRPPSSARPKAMAAPSGSSG